MTGADLQAIIPELILGGACLVLVPAAAFARGRLLHLPVCVLAAALSAAIAAVIAGLDAPRTAFSGTFAADRTSAVFELSALAAALMSLAFFVHRFRRSEELGHAVAALAFVTLGAVGLASSRDLALILLFLQIMSFASYVLVALVREDRSAHEASLQYFVFGAVALAVMGYGLSFLYGLTGSLDLDAIAAALSGADRVWTAIALGMVLVGFGFEVTIVPFHFWAPGVFEGATAPAAAAISAVPKVGAFAGLIRFAGALEQAQIAWAPVLAVVAAVTMTLGNLAALRQTRLKRLLAYSGVAHAGYVLMAAALVHRAPSAEIAVAFYLAAFVFMNLGAFAVVVLLERALGSDAIDDLRGLSSSAPFAAVTLVLALLSLAGIPPLAGFAGKVLLLEVAVDGGLGWLAVIAALNMVVALYYYVSVLGRVFTHAPARMPARGRVLHAAMSVALAGTILLGVAPELLLSIFE